MTMQAGSRCGSYDVLERIGEGGMGSVYRANDSRLGREVALKVIRRDLLANPDALARFTREARLLASLNHPNIATIHGIEESEGEPFLVLELVSGPTLADHIAHRPIPVRESLALASQIAAAIEAAHARGIIHRDLKPANIKVTPGGVVKVLDFGLAKALSQGPADSGQSDMLTAGASRTAMGTILGTAAYMSPEQARGQEVDQRTDIWAFGCVLYDMLTGQAAFKGTTTFDTLAAVLTRDPDWSLLPGDLAPAIGRLMHRLLVKDPQHRLHDIADARIEIEDALAAPADDTTASSGPQATVRKSRISGRLIAAGLVIAGLSAALGWVAKPARQAAEPATIQFVMPLPEGQRLDGLDFPAIALSPLGSHVAFVASGGGSRQIFVRALSELAAQPVAGTDGASSPFFSHDGQWIGFFAGGKLKRVQVSGGPVRTVCDAAVGFGGTWAQDDTIIFAPDNGSALWQVPAAGGTPRAITTLDISRGEFSHRWPEMLPDGSAFLYTVGSEGSWDAAEIVVQSIAGGERHTVVHGGTSPKYLSSGMLLFAREGDVLAVPFDAKSPRAPAGAVRVLAGVMESDDGAMELSASRNGSIAYLAGRDRGANRALVWVDREGNIQPLAAPGQAYLSPRISPTGRTIALTIAGATQEDVWSYDIAQNALAQVTFEGGSSPVWSADGERIIFAASRGGRPNLFWKSTAAAGRDERLTSSPQAQTPGSCASVDAPAIAFDENHPDSGRDILLFDPVERTTRRVVGSAANESAPALSRDGRWMAFVSDQSGRNEVYVTAVNGSKKPVQVSVEGGTEPVWRRDGTELFFRAGNRMMVAAATTGPALAIGPARQLFQGVFETGAAARPAYDVAPDGTRFLMVTGDAKVRQSSEMRIVVGWTARPEAAR